MNQPGTVYLIHHNDEPFMDGTGRRVYFSQRNARIAFGRIVGSYPTSQADSFSLVPYVRADGYVPPPPPDTRDELTKHTDNLLERYTTSAPRPPLTREELMSYADLSLTKHYNPPLGRIIHD